MNTEFDNRTKPTQLAAAAVAVLITGLIVGAFEPAMQLIPRAEAATIAAGQNTAPVQRMDVIVVTAKRA